MLTRRSLFACLLSPLVAPVVKPVVDEERMRRDVDRMAGELIEATRKNNEKMAREICELVAQYRERK